MESGAPTRGEVWLVRFPRAIGVEVQEDRPAVVVNSSAFDNLEIRIIVPLMTWQEDFAERLNKVHIAPNEQNGLRHDSAADFLQVRSVSTKRLLRRIGALNAAQIEEIVAGIVIAIDYQP